MDKIVLAITMLFIDCISSTTECPETDLEALKSLHEFLDQGGQAATEGDVEGQVNRFTEDGIYMWPDRPSIEGHDQLREFFTDRFSRFRPNFINKSLELEVCDPWAYERGISKVTINILEKDTTVVVEEKYLNLLRLQDDGTWRLARRIRNRNHPMQVSGPAAIEVIRKHYLIFSHCKPLLSLEVNKS